MRGRFIAAVVFLAACTTYKPLPSPMTNVKFQSTELSGLVGGDPIEIYGVLRKPKGQGPFPAVVLLHTCGGLGPHVTRDWPNFLRGLGYVALTVDSYHPRGAIRCTELERDYRRRAAVQDAYGALDYLSTLPQVDGNRVAVMGSSAGANAINYYLLTKREGPSGNLDFKAAIGFYGQCHALFGYHEEDMPAMQIGGEKDVKHAPQCEDVGRRTPMEVHILPGVYHGFDSGAGAGKRVDPYGSVMLYDAGAVIKARQLTKVFLAKHLRN